MLVDRFFIWVAEATAEQKLRAVDALVAAYFDARIGDADRDAVEAALMLVAEDEDFDVRLRLAEALAEEDEAPRHLLLTLLDDHPTIAVAVAARSEALIDAELVDLVAHGGEEIRLAVARRRRVGPTVAVAIAEAAERAACVALLGNDGAEVPPIALERAVERFGEFSDLRQALLARPHVPINVRHRVLEKLSEAIENLVVVKSWMGSERAGVVTRDSKDKATIALAGSAGGAEMVVLVEHLRRTGQLTTRLMLRAACVGNLRFVEEALASLADMPSARVSALVADGREGALRALYRRSAMPERAWPAFHAAVEVHRELLLETGGLDGRPGDQARFSRRLVERVLTRFTAFERRDADDLLVLLRRFAADAARDHVKNVMAERMADAGRALAAPPEAPLGIEMVAADTGAPSMVDLSILGAIAAELGVAIEATIDPIRAAEAEFDESSDAARFETAIGVEPVDDPAVEPEAGDHFGLFAHVRLEDLPPEWLSEEVAPEALWGDDDIPYRRTLAPELRLVGEDTTDAAETAATVEAAAACASIELDTTSVVGRPVAAEIVAADEAADPQAFVDGLRVALDAVLGDRARPDRASPVGLRGAA